MVWEHRHTKLPHVLTDNYYKHTSLSSDYQPGYVITSWVQNCGSAILREIEDPSLLWYCGVLNGGYGRFERVFFFHVQNLSRPRRANWIIIGKPRESLLFLFSNSGHTASFHVLSNSLLIHRNTTGWNIVRGVSGEYRYKGLKHVQHF